MQQYLWFQIFINNPNFLTENQLKELEKNKITIESHTVNHFKFS